MTEKLPDFRLYGDVNKRRDDKIFLLFISELGYGSSEFSSNRVCLLLRSNFVKIIAIKIERRRIHFESHDDGP